MKSVKNEGKKENTLSFLVYKENHTYFSNFLALLFFVTFQQLLQLQMQLLLYSCAKKFCQFSLFRKNFEKNLWKARLIIMYKDFLRGMSFASEFFLTWKNEQNWWKNLKSELKLVCCDICIHMKPSMIFSIAKLHMSFLLQLTVERGRIFGVVGKKVEIRKNIR